MIRLFVGLLLLLIAFIALGASLALQYGETTYSSKAKARTFIPIASMAGAAGLWLFFDGLDVITSE